jgi:hypothetical protein
MATPSSPPAPPRPPSRVFPHVLPRPTPTLDDHLRFALTTVEDLFLLGRYRGSLRAEEVVTMLHFSNLAMDAIRVAEQHLTSYQAHVQHFCGQAVGHAFVVTGVVLGEHDVHTTYNYRCELCHTQDSAIGMLPSNVRVPSSNNDLNRLVPLPRHPSAFVVDGE